MKDQGVSRRSFPKATAPAILWFLSDRSERNSPPQRRNLCFVLGGCSACGRATFQRRKVAKVLRACGPGPRRVALFRWHSRPARKPQDGCPKIIAAALLNRWDSCFYKIRCACVVQHTPWAVNRRHIERFSVRRGWPMCQPPEKSAERRHSFVGRPIAARANHEHSA